MSIFLGLDIGGTSLKLGGWAGQTRLLWNQGISVPESSDPEEVVHSIAGAVRTALKSMQGRPEALGIGSCGLISGGVIHQSPNTPWDELPLEPMLQEVLQLPVFLINDADAFLLGVLDDYAPGLTHVIGITLGTGLGTAIWHGSRLIIGGSGISPEGGHITLDVDGPEANTGIPGTFEYLACRAAVLRYYGEAGGQADDPLQVAAAAERGEAAAIEAWRRYGTYLGAGLGSLCNLFSPQAVLVGGGLAGAHAHFEEALRRALNRHMLRAFPRPFLSFLPERPDAVARGAANYAAMVMVDV